MFRRIKRISGIEGVSAGGNVRVKLPVNNRCFGLYFKTRLDGVLTVASDVVDRVRLYVNGLPMWDLPAAYILAEAARDGRTVTAGDLPIEFADPDRADKVDEIVTAWNLFGETSFEVEMSLKPQAGGVVVSIDGLRVFDYGQTVSNGKPLKQIVKKFTVNKNAVGGLNDLDNIPIRDAILRLSFFGAQLPTDFQIDADGDRILEASAADLAEIYRPYGTVPVNGSNAVRFDFTERIDDFLAVNKDLNVRFSLGAAASVDVLVQTLAPGYV